MDRHGGLSVEICHGDGVVWQIVPPHFNVKIMATLSGATLTVMHRWKQFFYFVLQVINIILSSS